MGKEFHSQFELTKKYCQSFLGSDPELLDRGIVVEYLKKFEKKGEKELDEKSVNYIDGRKSWIGKFYTPSRRRKG